MPTPSDRVRERNQEIAATIQPYAEELRESLEESGLSSHLPERGDVPTTEYVQAYRDSPMSLDEDGRRAVKEREAANLQDYLAAVGEAAAGYEVETAASLYSRHDTIPEDAIDADWYFVDAGYGQDAPSGGVRADCTELPFQDDSLDLVLLKAPGGAFIPDSDEVVEEVERVLDDGIFAASDAYIEDPDDFEQLEAVTPEPAIYHSRLDRQDGEIRNVEGRMELYMPE